MSNALIAAGWLVAPLLIATAAFGTNETPGSAEAFVFEPYAFFSEVFPESKLALEQQDYYVQRLMDDSCDTDPGPTTLTSFKSGLRHGYGAFCVASHGEWDGFGVEAYSPDGPGFAAADSAYWAYINGGDWLPEEYSGDISLILWMCGP